MASFWDDLVEMLFSKGVPPDTAEKVVSGRLDPSRAARMQRADQQGFDTANPVQIDVAETPHLYKKSPFTNYQGVKVNDRVTPYQELSYLKKDMKVAELSPDEYKIGDLNQMQRLKDQGYDAFKIKGKEGTYVIDTANARSTNAMFDPANKGKPYRMGFTSSNQSGGNLMSALGGASASQLVDKYVSKEQQQQNEGLLNALKNIPADVWDSMHWLDKMALGASVTPVVNASPIAWGLGAAADIRSAVQEPDQFFTPTNLAITGGSYLPWGRLGKYGEQLGIWGGMNAHKAPSEARYQAYELFKQGKSPREIYEATGMKVDDIGNVTHEIPDYSSELRKPAMNFMDGDKFSVGTLLKHDKLFEAYPDLEGIPVKIVYKPQDSSAAAFAQFGNKPSYIEINMSRIAERAKQNGNTWDDEVRSSLLHELQHAVQLEEALPRGGNESVARAVEKAGKDAQYKIKRQKEILKKEQRVIGDNMGLGATKTLHETSRKLDEIKRLEGYLADYERNGSNLTNKRRNIFNSGAAIMDHNDEYRMRIDTITTPKWKKPAERNEDYANYIRNAIADARSKLDPNLVKQVNASGVKNPTKKYERQMQKYVKQVEPYREKTNALYKADEILQALQSESGRSGLLGNLVHNYKNLAGEVEARNVQERMFTPPDQLGNPFLGKEYTDYPVGKQTYMTDRGVDPEGVLGMTYLQNWEELYKKLGNK